MIVVSDTSPINYLVLVEIQDLLPKLLDRILIPEAVHRELQSAAAPDPTKRFLAEAPDWLEVRAAPEISSARSKQAAASANTLDALLRSSRLWKVEVRTQNLEGHWPP